MPTLTFDLKYIAPDIQWDRQPTARVETNATDGWFAGGSLYLPDAVTEVGRDGTGQLTLAATPGDARYRLVVEYHRHGANRRDFWRSEWFPLTADADLSELTTTVVPPLAPSMVTLALDAAETAEAAAATAEGSAEAASAARSGAQFAETGAAAERSAAEAAAATARNISGIAVPDDVVKTLIEDPDSDTSGALRANFAREKVLNLLDFGLTASTASEALTAALGALPAHGGTIIVPAGDWTMSSQVIVTKPVEIRGAHGSNEFSASRLRPLPGVAGIRVDLPLSGDRFEIRNVALVSHGDTAVSGAHGLHLRMGRPVLQNVAVYGFGDHGVYFDSTAGGNVNHALSIGLRCYGNFGDGVRLAGVDSNACTFIGLDAVANHGWGVANLSNGHNVFLNPHFDQQYHGSPGAVRDNSMSSRWEWVYEENGSAFLIDHESVSGHLSFSTFGPPSVTVNGVAHTTWEIVRPGGARNRIRTTNGTKQYQLGSGLIGSDTFDITNETDGANIVSVGAEAASWWRSQFPAGANYDLGWAGARWRDLHLSRHLRIGSILLRDNAGTLEKSTDGSTWAAV